MRGTGKPYNKCLDTSKLDKKAFYEYKDVLDDKDNNSFINKIAEQQFGDLEKIDKNTPKLIEKYEKIEQEYLSKINELKKYTKFIDTLDKYKAMYEFLKNFGKKGK